MLGRPDPSDPTEPLQDLPPTPAAADSPGDSATSAAPSPGLASADLPERFWQLGPELAGLHVRVRPPEVELQVLKVLGEPTFAEDPTLERRLAQVYAAVTERALRLAYGESGSAAELANHEDDGPASTSEELTGENDASRP